MTKETAATIGIRLIALLLVGLSLSQLPMAILAAYGTMIQEGDVSATAIAVSIVVGVFPLLIAWYVWDRAPAIGNRLFKFHRSSPASIGAGTDSSGEIGAAGSDESSSERISPWDLQTAAFSVIGLILVGTALPDLVQYVITMLANDSASGDRLLAPQYMPAIISTVLRGLFGFWILQQARSISDSTRKRFGMADVAADPIVEES